MNNRGIDDVIYCRKESARRLQYSGSQRASAIKSRDRIANHDASDGIVCSLCVVGRSLINTAWRRSPHSIPLHSAYRISLHSVETGTRLSSLRAQTPPTIKGAPRRWTHRRL